MIRVLVADDHPIVRSGIVSLLQAAADVEVVGQASTGTVAQGLSNPATVKRLFVGEATVKTHLLHVFDKLEVNDRTRAVTRAMELGLL